MLTYRRPSSLLNVIMYFPVINAIDDLGSSMELWNVRSITKYARVANMPDGRG